MDKVLSLPISKLSTGLFSLTNLICCIMTQYKILHIPFSTIIQSKLVLMTSICTIFDTCHQGRGNRLWLIVFLWANMGLKTNQKPLKWINYGNMIVWIVCSYNITSFDKTRLHYCYKWHINQRFALHLLCPVTEENLVPLGFLQYNSNSLSDAILRDRVINRPASSCIFKYFWQNFQVI